MVVPPPLPRKPTTNRQYKDRRATMRAIRQSKEGPRYDPPFAWNPLAVVFFVAAAFIVGMLITFAG